MFEQVRDGCLDYIPIVLGFTAKRTVNFLYIPKQMRHRIQKIALALKTHLIAQAQGPFDRHALIAEIVIVENFTRLALAKPAILTHHRSDIVLPHLTSLVAQAATHGLPAGAGINELNFALAVRLLAVGDEPDIGADAGVVEHLFRQGDNSLKPVVLNHPFANLALSAAGTAGKERRAVKNNGQTRAVLVLLGLVRLKLAEHMLQEEQRAVVHPWQAGPESSAKAQLFMLALHHALLFFPVHPKRRVGQQIIELPFCFRVPGRIAVVQQRITKADIAVLIALHEQVRGRNSIGARIEILSEYPQFGLGVMLAQIILGLSQHPARAARRVKQLVDKAGPGQGVVIRVEQNINHQTNDFTRGKMIAGGLVGRFVKAPDQVLEQEAHLEIIHGVGV